METDDNEIARCFADVRARIAAAAVRSGRAHDAVKLVAVTKTVEPSRIAAVIRAGATDLGENYVQEARRKIPEVAHLIDVPAIWHLIGHLQSNKAKYSVELFSLIHSVDNYQVAQELGKQASKRGQTQAVLIEVNLTETGERAGAPPDEAHELAERIAGIPGLNLQGLMGIAPITEHSEGARPHFARLRALWETLPPTNRRVLSMGMTGDFEIAIEEGATLVRIGTALFGRRGG